MKIQMAAEFGTQLQGETPGRRHYAHACDLLAGAAPGEVIALDFGGVDVVTGSWIAAMLVPLYRRAAEREIDLYPVICDVGEAPETEAGWLDDLVLLAKWTHQCFLTADQCELPIERARLIGQLDPAQQTTLQVVAELGPVTGAELERRRPGEAIRATAWNNRLKELNQKRLLRREKRGREQVYSLVVEQMQFDG